MSFSVWIKVRFFILGTLIFLFLLFTFSCNQINSNAQTKNRTGQKVKNLQQGMIRKNMVGMKLVYVPSGKFLMGSNKSDLKEALAISRKYNINAVADWMKDESPQREIKIKKGFGSGNMKLHKNIGKL